MVYFIIFIERRRIMQTLLKGLTEAEVRERTEAGQVNALPEDTRNSVRSIIFKNVFTYFNLIFTVLAVLVILVGSYNSLLFLPVVIANTIIGIVQQLYAKKVLDNLTLMSVTECTVVRDGKEISVPVNTLVRDDIVKLTNGNQIPADAEVLEGLVRVNESLLTGESDEIEKKKGSGLKSGSFVVSGTCYAKLISVGESSYASRLTAEAKSIKDRDSEMIKSINGFVKFAGIAIIPIGITLFLQGIYVNDLSYKDSVVSMVAAVIGMIPEGLYLLVTIALALSAARLATKHVLLHDMRSTETLARVDVLCVDKTGTITDNKMNVTDISLPVDSSDSSGSDEQNKLLLARYISSMDDTNATMEALRSYFTEEDKIENIVKITSFSSKLKYSEIETGEYIYRLGAPEFLLGEDILEKNAPLVEGPAEAGQRVLAFVRILKSQPMDEKNKNAEPLLFIALENGIRNGAIETFKYLQDEEVEIKVISGDNPVTVSAVARSVGINNADKYIDASTLNNSYDYENAVRKYTVFGRVKPEQKRELVKAIKGTGKFTAMTGDGVNDILAMKEADCSIAMGTGSDAARSAAQTVLLDSDFSHMKDIIAEGRQDINNITRSAILFLYKNLFSMFLAIFSIINTFKYPLNPSQISLISAFNIGLPAFLLALEPNDTKQKNHFMRETILKSLPAALTSFLCIASMVIFGQVFHIAESDVSTASTYLLSIVGFLILFRLCKPRNTYRNWVFIGCLAGFIFTASFLDSLFSLQSISTPCVMLTVVFAIAEESLMRNFTELAGWIERKLVKG